MVYVKSAPREAEELKMYDVAIIVIMIMIMIMMTMIIIIRINFIVIVVMFVCWGCGSCDSSNQCPRWPSCQECFRYCQRPGMEDEYKWELCISQVGKGEVEMDE